MNDAGRVTATWLCLKTPLGSTMTSTGSSGARLTRQVYGPSQHFCLSRKTSVWIDFSAKSIKSWAFLRKEIYSSWQNIEFSNYLLEFFEKLA